MAHAMVPFGKEKERKLIEIAWFPVKGFASSHRSACFMSPSFLCAFISVPRRKVHAE
jgi:hypothetical protein